MIAGSLSLRDHAERQFGFNQVMAGEYPDLMAAGAEGRDDNERTLCRRELLERHDHLVGIYNVGAGNRGIAAALKDAGRARHRLDRT